MGDPNAAAEYIEPQSGSVVVPAESSQQELGQTLAQRQIDSSQPAATADETTTAALQRDRDEQIAAARATLEAVAAGNQPAAAQADFDRLTAEANHNIHSGQPDALLSERPNLSQAEAQAVLQEHQVQAPVATPTPAVTAEAPVPAEPLATVTHIDTQRVRQPDTLEDVIRRSASRG
ncbi:MAG TPA: hypothetical protein VMR75_03985 [Candidatus Saccharimonadales bacterium]|nr:hypothetical protein [Candidatus Saccharimonadales bacterium]